ncbi:unnamed protein product [Didymodactylos carnosus]|uniref:Uncharacterized protein n=1 Tax=Didymodactylos carnosus TaxID=1234261 RepID=A0A8S2Y8V7_9BILA|nr:unnamed protein product [Didymodactylos carnosus]
MRNNISAKAVNELHHIDDSAPTSYKIRLIRNDLNKKIRVIKTAHGAHAPMEDVIKTLIHVNKNLRKKIGRTITIRLSLDGTQTGDKLKLLVICINCPQFQSSTNQKASKILPLGLFRMEDENYDQLKLILPVELISSIEQNRKVYIDGEEFKLVFKSVYYS